MRTDSRVDAALASRDGTALEALAREGVDLNEIVVATDTGPRTPLEQALHLADRELVGLVLSIPGVSAARSLPEHGYWSWAQHAPLEVVREFLERSGVQPGQQDVDGRTLLHEVAAGDGDVRVVRWLLDRVDADQAAADGTTAFFHAAVHGHLEAAAALHRGGANPNAASSHAGWTALITAVAAGLDDVVRWLLDIDGLDVNRADHGGATALHHAARRGDVGDVEALMAHVGTDWLSQDALGRTPLMDAARLGNAEVVDALLGPNDAGINMVDVDRRTALHHGVVASSLDVVRLLVERPDINLAIRQDQSNSTALELALASGDEEIAALLQAARERAGAQDDRPTNDPPLRPPAPELGDPHQYPGIADPPPDYGGS
jgi:ankyrin repeat protein